MKCVSLFSGAGGLDLGLKAAGFSISASVEMDEDCCRTLRRNGQLTVYECPAADADYLKLLDSGAIDLVAGGPPCQPFSKSSLWTNDGPRGVNDPRASTINDFFDAIEILEPRAFLLENVPGFARWGGLFMAERRVNSLRIKGLDYKISSSLINAADFGVPQKRIRFVLIGVRDLPPFKFPTKTHGNLDYPYTTSWDALASVGDHAEDESLAVRGRWADLLPTIPPGENYLWHTPRGDGEPLFGWRTRYWSFLNKLHPDIPSPTIVASPSQNSGPFHWENRLLSTSELAAIQTFPTSYSFAGNRSSRQRQIGNAVPPLLAEHLGIALYKCLGTPSNKSIVYNLPKATTRPEIPISKKLPEKYNAYVGRHADHPGSGLGPKAKLNTTRQLVAAK